MKSKLTKFLSKPTIVPGDKEMTEFPFLWKWMFPTIDMKFPISGRSFGRKVNDVFWTKVKEVLLYNQTSESYCKKFNLFHYVLNIKINAVYWLKSVILLSTMDMKFPISGRSFGRGHIILPTQMEIYLKIFLAEVLAAAILSFHI